MKVPNDDDIKRLESKIDGLVSSLGGLNLKMESMEKAIQSLNAKMASFGSMTMDASISDQYPAQSMKFAELAEQLRSSVAEINESATVQSKEGKHAFMISDLDAEIKGRIQKKDEDLHLTQLTQDSAIPESISTIRFSLRPVPVIKVVGDSEE
jgi:hypothetical protein